VISLRRLRCRCLGHGPFCLEGADRDDITLAHRGLIEVRTKVRCRACDRLLILPMLLNSGLLDGVRWPATASFSTPREALEQSLDIAQGRLLLVGLTETARPAWLRSLRRMWR
jgi:hypothetical protein